MNSVPICPYCQVNPADTGDHIFPDFLGGSKKISACKPCNDIFGGTFEGKAANDYFTKLHVLIVDMGLPLKAIQRTVQEKKKRLLWKNACLNDKYQSLDISTDGLKTKTELSSPVVENDGIFQAFRTHEVFIQVNKNLATKGKETLLESYLEERQFKRLRTRYSIVIDTYVQRVALKMCLALATTLPDFDFRDIREACIDLRSDLDKEKNKSKTLNYYSLPLLNRIKTAYCKYDQLESWKQQCSVNTLPGSLRTVSHIIYVERNQLQVYGVVQFFGVFQIYCSLGKNTTGAKNFATLGELDPISDKEHFITPMPQNLPEPPNEGELQDLYKQTHVDDWTKQLHKDVIKRGGNPERRIELLSSSLTKGLTLFKFEYSTPEK